MPSDAYMEISPMDIWGESGDKSYGLHTPYGMFEVFNIQFTQTNAGFDSTDGASSPDSDTKFGKIGLSKAIDYSSPDLFRYCCNKTVMDWAILYVREAGDQSAQPWLRVELTKVMITNFAWNLEPGGAGDELNKTEQIELEFQKLLMAYSIQDPTGQHDGEKQGMWNYADQNGKVDPIK